MRIVPLSDNLASPLIPEGTRTSEAAIHAEIAERILELRELVGPLRTTGFFQKMLAIWTVEPPAFWVVVHLLTGDLSEITMSYTQQGKLQSRTKQATQQELERVIIALNRHYPELAKCIIQMRNITADTSEGS